MSDQITYAAGVKHCRTCKDPLGEITCPKTQTWFSCGRPECNVPKNMLVPIQFLPEGKVCDAEDCPNLAERRAYPKHQKLFYCSDECREVTGKTRRLRAHGAVQAHCYHCGTDLGLRLPTKSGLHFCYGHDAASRHEESEAELCGRFLDIYKMIYEPFADQHYSKGESAARHVKKFLNFLDTQTQIQSLGEANLDHIGQYIAHEKESGKEPRVDFIRVFFQKLRLEGHHAGPNPVRPSLHYKKEHRNEPRIYSDRELREHMALLEERGDTQTRAIYSLGFEAGPRMAELCNLRVPDVKFDERKVWFRDRDAKPDGDQYSHWGTFGDEAATWLGKWLEDWPGDCGHDFVFVNAEGDPLMQWSLRDRMNAVLLCKSKSREHENGVDHFSLEKLRRTNIWLYRKQGLDDSMNMRIHGIRAVATMKRFNKVMREDEIETYLKAVSRDKKGRE